MGQGSIRQNYYSGKRWEGAAAIDEKSGLPGSSSNQL